MHPSIGDLINLLRECVVPINHGGDKGTGFFVAKDLILTCAHVVSDSSDQPILVRWHGEDKQAKIERMGNAHDLDFAILRLEAGWSHPCALLGTDVVLNDPFYAFGHPDGNYREGGDSATFIYEGSSFLDANNLDTELYKFKEGEAAPGLSGAPLLNQRSGVVCAVVSTTRRRDTDLGGRGVPISLLQNFAPKLFKHNEDCHNANPAWKMFLQSAPAQPAAESASAAKAADPEKALRVAVARTEEVEVESSRLRRQQRQESDIKRYGFYAEELSIEKKMENDGSSVLHYYVRNLVTTRDPLIGFRFLLKSAAGCVSFPQLDPVNYEQLFHWQPKSAPRTKRMPLIEKLASVRNLDGIIYFGEPLRRGDPPISFGWTVELLNGAALSDWEFNHLYPCDLRKHVNEVDLPTAMEYYARMVWFPTLSFRVRLVLPERITTAPRLSIFKCGDRVSVPVDEVVSQGIMQSYVGNESEWAKANVSWQRDRLAEVSDAAGLKKQGPGDYVFSTDLATVGWSYSLDWLLPRQELDGGFENLINLSKEVRERLIEYAGHDRPNGSDDAPSQTSRITTVDSELRNQKIHQLLADFDREMRDEYRPNNGEHFSVALMTYDNATHHLVTVDGFTDGKRFSQEERKFWLPFGLGLGGACFRNGLDVMGYIKPSHPSDGDADYYLAVTETLPNEVLIALAVDHPKYHGFATPVAESERCRQIIAIVTLSSTKVTNELSKLRPGEGGKIPPAATQLFHKLRTRCQVLGTDLTTLVQPQH
jgi:hypothetical protein